MNIKGWLKTGTCEYNTTTASKLSNETIKRFFYRSGITDARTQTRLMYSI